MYKVVLRSNLILCLLVLAAATVAVIYIPRFYPDNVLEVPSVALFAGEVGLSLLLALLFYESARTDQSMGLAANMFGFSMTIGAIGNFVCQSTQMLPDEFVMVSWIELAIMNLAGLIATICLFRLEPTEEFKFVTRPSYRQTSDKPKAEFDAVRRLTAKPTGTEPPAPVPPAEGTKEQDFTPPAEVSPPLAAKVSSPNRSDSAKGILEKLDIARINSLEQQLHPTEDISLDNLFQDENKAIPSVKPLPDNYLLEIHDSAPESSAPDMVANEPSADEVQTAAFDPNKLEEIDKLFSEFDVDVTSVAAETASKETKRQAVVKSISHVQDLKQFARLALKKSTDEPLGTMRTIGKMLLDVKAVENIIKIGQQMGFTAANARSITLEEGEEIGEFLKEIDGKQGVVGSLLVGLDGLVVAATIGDGLDSFCLGALSMAIYNHTAAVTGHLALGGLRQTILQSAQTVAVITSVSRGLLVVFADSNELGPLKWFT